MKDFVAAWTKVMNADRFDVAAQPAARRRVVSFLLAKIKRRPGIPGRFYRSIRASGMIGRYASTSPSRGRSAQSGCGMAMTL